MNIKWLQGLDHLHDTVSPEWRADYDAWIAQDPEMRGQFADRPTSIIYGCHACFYVWENRKGEVGATPCGHAAPYYVRFGEHERQAVQAAVERWEQERKNRRIA